MASPGQVSSGSGSGTSSSLIQNSGSEDDLRQLMDLRKRKRMISNRDSARRSRMRKQKHLDDLTAQVSRLRNDNGQILASLGATTQQYLNVEGENDVLRAQVGELSHRLESLNEIVSFMGANGGLGANEGAIDGFLNDSWNYVYLNQPIMASADAQVGFY